LSPDCCGKGPPANSSTRRDACAVAAVANIVSGDHDLLAIKKYREIEIVSAAEFIARFRKS